MRRCGKLIAALKFEKNGANHIANSGWRLLFERFGTTNLH